MFDKLISKILKSEQLKGKINLMLVDDNKIRELNWQFRHKNRPTDVLAFPMREDGILGDIAISTETAERNAKSFGVSYKTEMKRLVIHGTLHLAGYDHGKEMRSAEKIYQKL